MRSTPRISLKIEGKNTDRVFVHAHLGIQTFDDIMAKLRYMVVGCGCDYVVFDHLHMLIRAMNGSSEREIIDESMLRLRSLVEETHCSLHLISHLSRISGSSHERGGQVEMSHLRGSQGIGQLSDMIIAAERDQQAEDDTDRNLMRLRVIKNRLVGKTGTAGCLRYDDETGRLIEVDEDVEFEQEEF
jgi:twinkle protein